MLEFSIVIAVIVGLVEAIKRATNLDTRFAPIVSIAIGLLIVGLFGVEGVTSNLLDGIIAGLTASGLYSGTKATLK